MLARHEHVGSVALPHDRVGAMRACASRAHDDGSAPSTGRLGTVRHTIPMLACRSVRVGLVVNGMVALAGSPHDRTTRHGPTLAPTWGAAPPAVVAWAEAARTACHRRGDAGAHTADELGERPVGCTAHPGRTGKARRTGLTYDHCEVHGSTARSAVADMVHLPAPSCLGARRRRSVCGARPPSSGLVHYSDPCLPALAGLLDDERSEAVRPVGHCIPHTAELYGVCAQPLGSSSRRSCLRP